MRARGSSGSRQPQNSWSHSNSSSTNFGSSSNNSSRPTCQICNRPRHSAHDCFHRMNHAYEGRIPTQKLMVMAAASSLNNPHTTWISNIGASNHITSDLANLAIHNEYHGQDQVLVGNGAG